MFMPPPPKPLSASPPALSFSLTHSLSFLLSRSRSLSRSFALSLPLCLAGRLLWGGGIDLEEGLDVHAAAPGSELRLEALQRGQVQRWRARLVRCGQG